MRKRVQWREVGATAALSAAVHNAGPRNSTGLKEIPVGKEKQVWRKTCKRYDTPWDAHYLTFSCFQRRPFFSGRLAPLWFLETVDAARSRKPFDLWAYVIMPEHVHLLLWPHEGVRISEILYAIKKPLADRVLLWVRRNHPEFLPRMEERRPSGKVTYRFWQAGGGYDRNLWSTKDIHEKLVYIHNNPVRRELVKDPLDWPWSSYRTLMGNLSEPIRMNRQSMPVLGP